MSGDPSDLVGELCAEEASVVASLLSWSRLRQKQNGC